VDAVADSSYVVALNVTTEKYHQACVAVYREQRLILLPQSTLAEVTYLLQREYDIHAVIHFLRRLPESKFRLIALEGEDILRAAHLLDQYADTRVDFVDASIVDVAERLNIPRILTLDHRDFTILRPKHVDHLELLPQTP
jgi:predicted nucleic acid-binding protein